VTDRQTTLAEPATEAVWDRERVRNIRRRKRPRILFGKRLAHNHHPTENVEGAEIKLNRLQRQGRRVVVTGSNSRLLSSELATHLTGRYALTTSMPFLLS